MTAVPKRKSRYRQQPRGSGSEIDTAVQGITLGGFPSSNSGNTSRRMDSHLAPPAVLLGKRMLLFHQFDNVFVMPFGHHVFCFQNGDRNNGKSSFRRQMERTLLKRQQSAIA